MQRSEQRILTTHTGSLPRPADLEAALVRQDRDGVVEVGFAELVRSAVRHLVARQVACGLSVVNDGEASKFGYATYVKERLVGFDGEPHMLALADLADFPDFARRVTLEVRTPSCTGPVVPAGTEAVDADIARLRDALAAAPPAEEAFLTAASPGIIASFLVNRHYPDDEAYLFALAEAMKPEYDRIVAAGFVLQVDAPDLALGRHLHPEPLDLPTFRHEAALRIEALNHAVRDIPPERMRLHVCWGNYEAPHHHDVELNGILDVLLKARPAGLSLEGANPRHQHEWRVFEDLPLPEGKVLVAGVIDTCTNYVEHPEVVAQRIERYAGVVGRENLIAGTDCGFATFADFHTVDPAVAWAKLESLVRGAELASRRLWPRSFAA